MGTYYMPGVCNINDAEVGYRRNAGHFFAAMSAILIILLVLFRVSPVFGLTATPSTFLATLQYLQVKNHFCVRFARSQIYSDGTAMGDTKAVTSEENAKLDKTKARKMNFQALLLGSTVGLITSGLLLLL